MKHIGVFRAVRDSMLSGRSRAKAHFPTLVEQMEPPGVHILDFSGIEFLSSSYFFGALWPFWTREDASGPNVFPLIANATQEISDEISIAMSSRRMGAWHGGFDGQIFAPIGLIGFVDPAHVDALNRAREGHGISAVELSSPEVKATAWNNRLNALYKQRLLVRHQSGRKYTYYAPWRGETNG